MNRRALVTILALTFAPGVPSFAALSFDPNLRRENVAIDAHLGGAFFDVALEGTRLYAVGAAGLQVWDVTDATAPRLAHEIILDTDTFQEPVPSRIANVTVADGHAYVVIRNTLYDVVVTGSELRVLVRVSLFDSVRDVAASDGLLYMATHVGLRIFDVQTFQQVGSLLTPPFASGYLRIAIRERHAFLLSGSSLDVVDARDPSVPATILSLPMPAHAIALSGPLGVVVEDTIVRVLDVGSPAATSVVGSTSIAATPCNHTAVECAATIAGDRAWVGGAAGVNVVDLGNPAAPQVLGSVATHAYVAEVAASDGIAYVANGEAGLRFFDFRAPATPVEIGVPPPADVADVAVAGDLLYVADGVNGLKIVDVAVPDALVAAGSLLLPGRTRRVATAGTFAYLGQEPAIPGEASALRVVDVADPREPTEVGSLSLAAPPRGLAVVANHAFLTVDKDLIVVDVSIPSAPMQIGALDLSQDVFYPGNVVAGDGVLYVGGLTVRIVDVTTPSAPAVVRSQGFSTRMPCSIGLAIGDDLLAVGACGGTLIFDIVADPLLAGNFVAAVPDGGAVAIGNGLLLLGGDLYDLLSQTKVGFLMPRHAFGPPAAGNGVSLLTSLQAGVFAVRHTPNDLDSDGVLDASDNCRRVPNVEQADEDGDRIGDACVCPGCDDDDPCTVDLCEVGFSCFTRDRPGLEAASCIFEKRFDSEYCDAQRVPRKIFRIFRHAGRFARRAVKARKQARATRLLGRSEAFLERTLATIGRVRSRRNPPITEDCAARLDAIVIDARTRIAAARGTTAGQ